MAPFSLLKRAGAMASTRAVEESTDPNLLLGALEIGIFVSTFLFGVLMAQGRIYWQQRKRDGWRLRLLVVLLLALEFGHTIACMASVYYFTVTTSGYSAKPGNCYSFSIALAFGAFAIALVQIYYVFRCYSFSSNLSLSLIGYSLVLLHISGTLWITYESWLAVADPNPFKVQTDFGWLVSVTFAVGVLVDVYAAGCMCWYLKRSLDGTNMTFESTTGLVKKLLLWTIQTGLATSVASIAVLVCFQLMKYNYIWTAIYLSLTKLYSISVLSSLNQRTTYRARYLAGDSTFITGVAQNTVQSASRFQSKSPSSTPSSSRPASLVSVQAQTQRRWSSARSIPMKLSGAAFRRSTVAT